MTVRNQNEWTYISTDSDKRALWKNDGKGRIAGVWYSQYPTTNSFYIDLNLADAGTHRLAVYALDWFNQGRAIQTDVLNAATGQILATRQLQSQRRDPIARHNAGWSHRGVKWSFFRTGASGNLVNVLGK